MTLTSNSRGIIYMLLTCITFVSGDSFLKLLLRDIPPLQTLALRGVFATLWGFMLVAALGFTRDLWRAFGFWNLMRAFVEVASVLAFIFALANAPLADVTAIYQIAPLLVLGGSAFLYGEHVGALRWALIAVGLTGALLVAQPGTAGTSPYLLLSFFTAIASAGRDLVTRKVDKTLPGPAAIFPVVLIVCLSACVTSAAFETWVPLQPMHYAYGAAAGFFVMLAHVCVFLAFRHATARAVAPFYYGLTVCAVAYGAAFFGEIPNTLSVLGMALIIACGLGVLLLEQKEDPA